MALTLTALSTRLFMSELGCVQGVWTVQSPNLVVDQYIETAHGMTTVIRIHPICDTVYWCHCVSSDVLVSFCKLNGHVTRSVLIMWILNLFNKITGHCETYYNTIMKWQRLVSHINVQNWAHKQFQHKGTNECVVNHDIDSWRNSYLRVSEFSPSRPERSRKAKPAIRTLYQSGFLYTVPSS